MIAAIEETIGEEVEDTEEAQAIADQDLDPAMTLEEVAVIEEEELQIEEEDLHQAIPTVLILTEGMTRKTVTEEGLQAIALDPDPHITQEKVQLKEETMMK